MKAKEALELALSRKDHWQLIALIEKDAKEGKTECSLEILGCWWSEEDYYELTKEDRVWLILNGYEIKVRKEEFLGDEIDVEYITWNEKNKNIYNS
jgi:uncharacterized protein YjiK